MPYRLQANVKQIYSELKLLCCESPFNHEATQGYNGDRSVGLG